MTTAISLPSSNICVLGRADVRDNDIAFDWTNSGVFFRFCGNKVTFHFDAPALNQRLFIQIKVDGRWSRMLITAGQTDATFVCDEDCTHRVSCVRINEVLDAVPLVMTGITLDGAEPALLAAPRLPERRMLFIGDSITCGFGVLTNGPGNGFTTEEQDGAHTYAALTAEHFQAQAHFICISGRGIVRNCDDTVAPLIPEFFDWTTVSNPTPWDHTSYQPDVIVCAAGTNDADGENSIAPEKFLAGAQEFARRLRALYPHAHIIWMYGMMNNLMHDVLSEGIPAVGDDKLSYLPVRSVGEFEIERGACAHPNITAHHRIAGKLIPTISDIVDWDK